MGTKIFTKTDCLFKRIDNNDIENNFLFVFKGTNGKRHTILALNKNNLSDLSYIQELYSALNYSKTFEPVNLNISNKLGASLKAEESGLSAESDYYLYQNKFANFPDIVGKFSPEILIGNVTPQSSDYKAAQIIYEVTGGDFNRTINNIGITLGLRMLNEKSWKKRSYKRLEKGNDIEIPKNPLSKLKVIIEKYNSEISKIKNADVESSQSEIEKTEAKAGQSEIKKAEAKASQKVENQQKKDKNAIKKQLKSNIKELKKLNNKVLECIREYNEALRKLKQMFPMPSKEVSEDVFNISKHGDKETLSYLSIMSLKTPVPGMKFIYASDDEINSLVNIIYKKNHPQSNSKNSELPPRMQW